MRHFLPSVALAAVTLLASTAAHADWVNFSGAENAPNIAEIHVNDDHVRIDLEIFVRDLAIFHRLLPNEFFEEAGIEAPPLAERLRDFAREDLQIITGAGRKLPARLKQAAQRMRKERPSPFAGGINPFTGRRSF